MKLNPKNILFGGDEEKKGPVPSSGVRVRHPVDVV